MKRICLFAGYDTNNTIQEYVLYYLSELNKIADIYYLSDNEMNTSELEKVANITEGSYSYKHNKYDFGSWSELIKKIGWNKIFEYDQLILANDSCYGPLFDLNKIFISCENKYDFWGITSSSLFGKHIQSYFLVMNKKAIKNEKIIHFFNSIEKKENYLDTVKSYEIGLSQLIAKENLISGTYMAETFTFSLTSAAKGIVKYEVPFLKVKAVYDKNNTKYLSNLDCTIYKLKRIIKNKTNYDIKYISNHLSSQNISIKKINRKIVQKKLLNFLFSCNRTSKGKLLIKVLKIPIFNFKI